MRIRAGLVAAILVTALPVVPAFAAGTPELLLSGTYSAYVDVSFAKPINVREMESVATTRGRYAGFFLYRLGHRPTPDRSNDSAGSLYSPRLHSVQPGWPAIPFGFRDTLAAGRYRVYLFADGPTTVRVPVTGLARSLRLAPRTRVRSGIDVRDASALTDTSGNAVDGITEPVIVGPHTWVVSDLETYHTGIPNAFAEQLEACVTTTGTFRCPKAVTGFGESVEFEVAVEVVWHVPPGDLPPGPYVALQKRLGASTGSRVTGAAFWFDLA
jgi:hypothetical protein